MPFGLTRSGGTGQTVRTSPGLTLPGWIRMFPSPKPHDTLCRMKDSGAQSDKFKDLARELEADEDRWDERLRKTAEQKSDKAE